MDNDEALQKILLTISEVIKASVKDATSHLQIKPELASSSDEDFLSAEQAAKFLKIKLNTIYSKVEKGDLPHYRSGKRKLLFSKKELEDYITKRKGKSLDEINDEATNYLNATK